MFDALILAAITPLTLHLHPITRSNVQGNQQLPNALNILAGNVDVTEQRSASPPKWLVCLRRTDHPSALSYTNTKIKDMKLSQYINHRK